MRHRSLLNRTDKTAFWKLVGCGMFFCISGIAPCDAAIIAYLSESRAISGEKFESDLLMAGTSDGIGDIVEFIDLDVIKSTVNSSQLTDFTKIRFDASPRFAPWQDGQQFGSTPGFESRISLESFGPVGATPYPIVDTNPFQIGTITFDYSGIGLQVGDSITLDLLGVDDGTGIQTTSVAIRPAGSLLTTLVNPDFTSSAGSERNTFTIPTAIPEPGLSAFLSFTFAMFFAGRRSRRPPRRLGSQLTT
jgi:hypothetical protein